MTLAVQSIPQIALSTRDETSRRLVDTMRRQLGQFAKLLEDPALIELMLNHDGSVWADRAGQGMAPVGTMSSVTAESFIATVASSLRSAVTRESPILECELIGEPPFDRSRFEAMIPPAVPAPVFTIRRRASALFSLADYEARGIISADQRRIISDAVYRRYNILIAGGTTSGKTTFVNAVLQHIATTSPDHRLVLIEDTPELQCSASNFVSLRATDTVSMDRLLKATMRLRPDRIVVGEVRGGEALTLLKSWNTGHPGGVSTVHANNARDALIRIEQLIAEASQSPMRALIGAAVDLVVFIKRIPEAPWRRVTEILSVAGERGGEYLLENCT